MLDFINENSILIYKEYQGNISNSYVWIILNENISGTTVYNEVIDDIQYRFLFKYWWFVSTTETRKHFQNLC